MGWADNYIAKLQAGETISFRPRGNSMTGKINDGQLVTVSPDISNIKIGDAVLCRVAGAQYLHLVKALHDDSAQIGNNHGRINGWTPLNKVYGVVTNIQN